MMLAAVSRFFQRWIDHAKHVMANSGFSFMLIEAVIDSIGRALMDGRPVILRKRKNASQTQVDPEQILRFFSPVTRNDIEHRW
jgi:hypothetical protein